MKRPPKATSAEAARRFTATRAPWRIASACVIATVALLLASASASAAGCPNEAFRTGPSANLADCRAYELVAPLDQSDELSPLFWSTPDGNTTSFGSLGSFAGGLNGGGDGYVSQRGSGGWTTQAQAPPGGGAGHEPIFTPVDISNDGRQMIFSGLDSSPGAGRDVYLGDGPQVATNISGPVRVGLADEAYFEGQSANAGHVVFGLYVGGGYAGGIPQLYDYTGGSAKPVGILPGESTPSAGGAVLGSFEFGYGTGSMFNAISADGSRIFFESPQPPRSTNTGPPSPSGLYLRENGTTTKEIDPNGAFWGADASGSTVVYSPVEGEAHMGLSRYDVQSGTSTQIVPPSAEVTGVAGMSADTSHIYFTARAALTAGATAGQPNLYLYDGGSPQFIATLNEFESDNFASISGNRAVDSETSPDGRLLAFVSSKRLVSGYDNEGAAEVYLFDSVGGSIVCISCNADGTPPLGGSYLQTRDYGAVPGRLVPGQITRMPTNVTADGGRIFFQTPNPLSPRDSNRAMDVYVWEGGKASLISSGTGQGSQFVSATPSGDDVYFTTGNALVPQAKLMSELTTLYDARVDGGFPAATAAASCEHAGSCQGPLTAPPSTPYIGSIGFGGAGSPASKASVTVNGPKAVSGPAGQLQVRVPGAGRITVAGSSVRSTSKSVGKAGTYPVTIRLKSSAEKQLHKKGKVTVKARVSYQPQGGGSASKTVTVTFKQPTAKSGKGKKGGR